jgi:hypothetical protein
MMSTPMLDRLRKEGYGIKIELPDGSTLVIPAFAFVDDVDLIQELRDDDPLLPQNIVRIWEESLLSTGGALVPDKCRYSIVKYIWENDEWKTIHTNDQEIQIRIKGEDGSDHLITQIRNQSGELALGLKFSPTNNTKDEMEHLLEKSNTWAEKVRTGHLKRQEAWTCLETSIMNTINYAMPATTLSKSQLETIMKPVLDSGLPRAGICRKMARTIVFAPRKYLGLGIKHPYVTQGIRKIETLINQSQSTTLTLIEATWARMQIECGVGPHFLAENNIKIQQLATTGWLRSLWEFASTYNIHIRRPLQGIERQLRNIDDSYIMKEVCSANKWGVKELMKFNCCRLYLRLELTSDIITANGTHIQQTVWQGRSDEGHTNYVPSLFKQPKPGATAWSTWRNILKHTYRTNDMGRFENGRRPITRTDDWAWYFQPDLDRLYKKKGLIWDAWKKILQGQRTRSSQYGYPEQVQEQPEGLIPVTVYMNGEYMKIDGKGSQEVYHQQPKIPDWF